MPPAYLSGQCHLVMFQNVMKNWKLKAVDIGRGGIIGIIGFGVVLVIDWLRDLFLLGNRLAGAAAVILAMLFGVGLIISLQYMEKEKHRYLVRVFNSDGVTIKEQWILYAEDDDDAGKQAASDARTTMDVDYQVTREQ